jgi:hypothetical protein
MRESAQEHPVWKVMDTVEIPTTTELSVIRKVGPDAAAHQLIGYLFMDGERPSWLTLSCCS